MRFTFHRLRDENKPTYVRLRRNSDEVVADILFSKDTEWGCDELTFKIQDAGDRKKLDDLKKKLIFCNRSKFQRYYSQIKYEDKVSTDKQGVNDQAILDRIIKSGVKPVDNKGSEIN